MINACNFCLQSVTDKNPTLCLCTVLLALSCSGASAQGFASSEQLVQPSLEAEQQQEAAAVGKSFWIYYNRSNCALETPILRSTPNHRDTKQYAATTPTRVDIQAIVLGESGRFYRVLVDDKTTAFMGTTSRRHIVGAVSNGSSTTPCASYLSPDAFADLFAARAAAEAENRAIALRVEAEQVAKREAISARLQAEADAERDAQQSALNLRLKKPGARIGMTAKQVAEKTSWGSPDEINRTVTASGVHEQWVYGTRSYLYFQNGRLVAIQN